MAPSKNLRAEANEECARQGRSGNDAPRTDEICDPKRNFGGTQDKSGSGPCEEPIP